MAINFIKNAYEKNNDPFTHHAFIRYSIGNFDKEPLTIKVGKDIKLQGGFEYVNIFARLFAKLITGLVIVKGAVPTTKDIKADLKSAGLDFEEKRRFGKKGTLFDVSGKTSSERLTKFFEELIGCYFLLDLITEQAKLKMKKKETPKIGSPTDKFVSLSLPKEFLKEVIGEFLFEHDIASFKDAEILHTYKINDIKVDESLVNEDPNRAREEAVRKGKIVRRVRIDGEEFVSEFEFEA